MISVFAATVFICNGADNGIAGGGPGAGIARNNPPYTSQAGEIYNTNAAVGSRLNGLLAASGRARCVLTRAVISAGFLQSLPLLTGAQSSAFLRFRKIAIQQLCQGLGLQAVSLCRVAEQQRRGVCQWQRGYLRLYPPGVYAANPCPFP